MKISGQRRKAISPIVATVLIIAATLIAFAAVLGYIFGVFGSATNTAKVTATSVGIGAPNASNSSLAATGTQPASGYYGTITFSNSGSASASITSLTISYNGATNSYTLTTAVTVTSGSTASLYVTDIGAGAGSSGQTFNGHVTLSDGTQVSFTGAFS